MNKSRIGNFTSSEIVALTSIGKIPMTDAELAARPKTGTGSKTTFKEGGLGTAALTYIAEKNMERRLGRSLSGDNNSRACTWGSFVESFVHNLLPMSYVLCSEVTLEHEDIVCWKGSPDGRKFDEGRTVSDIKCPLTLKSFCLLVDPLYDGLTGIDAINKVRETHDDGEKYYWQLVSNSILTRSKFAELIVYMPYESELYSIMDKAHRQDEKKFKWIAYDENLPFIKDNGFYKNVNTIRFEVPEEDKAFLTSKVLLAKEKLLPVNMKNDVLA